MPATYSIFSGVIETTRKSDIQSVLQDLPNNTQKLIHPRDVRDAFLSTWANATFKLTSVGSSEYIGVDSNNPSDRDVKKKILIGKRSVGTQDIMSDSLLNSSDVDIFFYNTKSDSATQSSTKLGFLAGTNSSLFIDPPYIEAYDNGSGIELNIINPQQSLNLLSTADRVSINNIAFPTVLESSSTDINGKILKYVGIYPYGYLIWDDVNIGVANIGSTGSVTNIYGTVSLNGYNLEFIDDRLVPEDIGGIPQGMSFSIESFSGSNWPLSEVMRILLYPYVEPQLELNLTNLTTGTKYAEIGTTASLSFTYSLITYAREYEEQVGKYVLRTNGTASLGTWNVIESGDDLIGLPGDLFTFSSTYSIFSITQSTFNFGFMVCNIYPTPGYVDPTTSVLGLSYSIIDSLEYVAPFFTLMSTYSYAFSGAGLSDIISDSNTIKIIEPYPGFNEYQEAYYDGDGYIYFAFPASYGNLIEIMDPNGYILHRFDSMPLSSFTYSSAITPDSPYDYYGDYIIYKTLNSVSYTAGGEFKFRF